jgi:hypothetical protein
MSRASTWARLNQGKMEEEKLKLKTEEALQVGLKAVSDEIKAMPEVQEAFDKFYKVYERALAAKKENSVTSSK